MNWIGKEWVGDDQYKVEYGVDLCMSVGGHSPISFAIMVSVNHKYKHTKYDTVFDIGITFEGQVTNLPKLLLCQWESLITYM